MIGSVGRTTQIVIPVCAGLLAASRVAAPVIGQEGDIRRVHDPCIIKADGWYYVFSTSRGIAIRRSKDRIHWEQIGEVFDAIPAWARKAVPGVRSLWAPDICYFGGRFHLYYSVSTFGRNRSCIGLATNRTLDPSDDRYQWVDHGPVIASMPGRDNFNAIDPNIAFDGPQPWLVFGSFWSGIKLVRLDPETGLRSERDRRIYSIASRGGGAIEAPFVIKRGKFFYLFVSFDKCCRGVESTYKIKVGRSKKITGPYIDRNGRPMMKGGGTLVLAGYGRYRGPGHNAVLRDADGDWLVHHFYDASHGGVPTLQIRPIVWDEDGWPLAGEPEAARHPSSASQRPVQKDRLIGRWRYSVQFGDSRTITLCPDGRVEGLDSPTTWAIEKTRLILRPSRPSTSGAIWREPCFLSADGRWFVGRNHKGQIIRGIRIDPGKDTVKKEP